MKIMVLESDPYEQEVISNMLRGYDIVYKNNVAKAINHLGIERVDFAFVDADSQNSTYDWKDLTSFLSFLNIDYSIFSSNGKVGMKEGKTIVSIHDFPVILSEETNKEKI